MKLSSLEEADCDPALCPHEELWGCSALMLPALAAYVTATKIRSKVRP